MNQPEVPHNFDRRAGDRRASPDGRESLGIMFDKIVVYVFTGILSVVAGLLVWLCLQTVSLKQDTTAIIEHGKSVDKKLEEHESFIKSINDKTNATAVQITTIKIQMASHGWKE